MESKKFIRIKIAPERLINPDHDIRYILPDLITENSNEIMSYVGYDYLKDESNTMLLYFETDNFDSAFSKILEVIKAKKVLGNDLENAVEIEAGEGEVDADIELVLYRNVYKSL